MFSSCLLVLLLAVSAAEPDPSVLKNGGFEAVSDARPEADGLVNGWKLAPPPQVPTGWTPNPAYPGELAVIESPTGRPGAHSGQRFIRISAAQHHAHLYQMCTGLDPAQWYRVSAWVRGGAVSVSFYEYVASGKIGGQGVLQSTIEQAGWKRIEGFYRPTADGYLRSALAIAVPPGHSADVDDVAIEPLDLPAAPTGPDIRLEIDTMRLAISSAGLLREFRAKPSGKDYAVAGTPVSVLHAVCRGVATPLHSLTRAGDVVRAQFLDPEVRATLRVSPRKQHLLFEVLSQQAAPRLLPQVQERRALSDEQRHGQRLGLAYRPSQCLGRRPRRPEEVPRRAAAGDAGHGRELHASRRRLVLHV